MPMGSLPKIRNRRASNERLGSKEKAGSTSKKKTSLPKISEDPARRFNTGREEAQWKVSLKWAPVRKLNEYERTEANKMFFRLDSDGSGAIDADELGTIMRTLGQDPSEEECHELIASVDDPNQPDGLIQLREFYQLYAQGLDSKDKAGCLDSLNSYCYFGGDPKAGTRVTARTFHDELLDVFGLDIDVLDTFGIRPATAGLTQDDFQKLLGLHTM